MKKGSVIIEVLAAISIAVTAVVALVQLSNKSISNSGVAKRQSQATGYAVQGNEWIKGRLNELGWTNFEIAYGGGNYCLSGGNLSSGGACTVDGTNEFQRVINITYDDVVSQAPPPPTVRQMTVISTVSWADNSRTLTAEESVTLTRR